MWTNDRLRFQPPHAPSNKAYNKQKKSPVSVDRRQTLSLLVLQVGLRHDATPTAKIVPIVRRPRNPVTEISPKKFLSKCINREMDRMWPMSPRRRARKEVTWDAPRKEDPEIGLEMREPAAGLPEKDMDDPFIFRSGGLKAAREGDGFWTDERDSLLSLKRANPVYDSDTDEESAYPSKRTKRTLDVEEDSDQDGQDWDTKEGNDSRPNIPFFYSHTAFTLHEALWTAEVREEGLCETDYDSSSEGLQFRDKIEENEETGVCLSSLPGTYIQREVCASQPQVRSGEGKQVRLGHGSVDQENGEPSPYWMDEFTNKNEEEQGSFTAQETEISSVVSAE